VARSLTPARSRSVAVSERERVSWRVSGRLSERLSERAVSCGGCRAAGVVRRVPRGGCRAAGVGACRVVRRWPSAASHFAGFMSRLILLALCRVTYYLLVTNTSTAQTTPCGSGARGSSITCSTSSVLTPLRYGARKKKSRGGERRRQEARARRKGAAKTQQRGSKEGAQP